MPTIVSLPVSTVVSLPMTTIVFLPVSTVVRAQELPCESRGGRSGLSVPNSPYGLSGRKATLNLNSSDTQSSGAARKSRLPVPNSPCGLCGRKATLNLNSTVVSRAASVDHCLRVLAIGLLSSVDHCFPARVDRCCHCWSCQACRHENHSAAAAFRLFCDTLTGQDIPTGMGGEGGGEGGGGWRRMSEKLVLNVQSKDRAYKRKRRRPPRPPAPPSPGM